MVYLEAIGGDGVMRVYRASSADPRWVELPELTGGRGPLQGQTILVGDGSAWLTVTAGDVRSHFASTDGGRSWDRRDGVPCPDPQPGPEVGVGDGASVVVVCRTEDGARSAGAVYLSGDGGKQFDLVAQRPLDGPVGNAAARGRTILAAGPASPVANTGVLNASFDGGRTWSQVAEARRDGRFGAIRFLTPSVVVAVEDSFPSPSSIWRSEDGGRTWRPVAL